MPNGVPDGVPEDGLNSTNPSEVLPKDSIYKDIQQQPQSQKPAEVNLKEKNPAPKTADQGKDQRNKKSVISSARKGYAAGKKFRDGVLRATGGEDHKK